MHRTRLAPTGLFAILLACLMLFAFPARALASSELFIIDADKNGRYSEYYILDYYEPASGDTWSWDGDGTLTIDGFNGAIWFNGLSYAFGNLQLVVAGDSHLFAEFTNSSYEAYTALRGPSDGSLTITGNGKLEITIDDVPGEVTLEDGDYRGIYFGDDIVIDGADVSIRAGKGSALVDGIYAGGDVKIVNGSHVDINISGIQHGVEYTNGKTSYGAGITAEDAITISDSSVYVQSSTNAMNCEDTLTVVNSTVGATTNAFYDEHSYLVPIWSYEGFSLSKVTGDTSVLEDIYIIDSGYYAYALNDGGGAGTTHLEPKNKPFKDCTALTPHYDDVLWLSKKKVSTGFPDSTFRPYDSVARCDMAAFLYRMAGSPSYTPSSKDKKYFSDVNSSTPHAKEIWWLASKGISRGWTEKDGSHTFRPYENVARCDMAAFLYRLAGEPGYSPSNSQRKYFSDIDSSSPHSDEVWWLASTGVSAGWTEGNGRHTFRPYENVTRCDMAAFLHRMGEKDLVATTK